MSSKWWHGIYGAMIPESMIVGLKAGASLPEYFTNYTAADDKLIQGTIDDELVGTSDIATAIQATVDSSGGHVLSDSWDNYLVGGDLNKEGSTSEVGKDFTTNGSHSGHVISIDLTIKQSRLRLIQAQKSVLAPIGIVGFGISDIGQSGYDLLNDHAGYLSSGDTYAVDQVATPNTTTSATYTHDHLKTYAGGDPDSPDDYGTSNPNSPNSHTHSGGTISSINVNLARMYVKAFEIIDNTDVTGFIGLWPDVGIPDGWELLAMFDGYNMQLTGVSGDLGTTDGNNTVTFSGSTGSASHRHLYSGGTAGNSTWMGHSSYISHYHNYSNKTVAHYPDRHFLKILRKI